MRLLFETKDEGRRLLIRLGKKTILCVLLHLTILSPLITPRTNTIPHSTCWLMIVLQTFWCLHFPARCWAVYATTSTCHVLVWNLNISPLNIMFKLKAQLLSWFCFLILLKLAYCLSSGKVTSQSLFSKAILFDCCLVMGRYLISNSPLSSPHSLVLPSVSPIFICAKWVGWHVFFYFDI